MLLFLTHVAGAVPLQMTQQGRVLDTDGAPYEGLHSFYFRVYDQETGGTMLWEDLYVVQVTNGYYATTLGANESINPLDHTVFSLYPVFLELTINNGVPLSRQAIQSAPYAQMAGVSESVDGGSVSASEVLISGAPVIDSDGNWVGPAPSTDWSNIQGVPGGFADGVDDVLTEPQVDLMVSSGAIDLSNGSSMAGDLLLTVSEDQDSLALFSCLDGQVLKYDATIGDWFCDTDIDSLSVLSCTQGQSAIYDEGLSGWVCGDAAGALGSLSCQEGELAAFNNGAWSCQALENIFDQDGDGFSVWDDCDDNNPSSSSTKRSFAKPFRQCIP